MNLVLANMPLEADAQVHWIEAHLVGAELRALVSELAAVHGNSTRLESLETVLHVHRTDVLANGLSKLPREGFQTLLKHPRLLFDLQRLVIDEGGEYWDQIRNNAPVDEKILRGWEKLNARGRILAAIPARPAAHSRWRFIAKIAAAAAIALAALTAYHLAVPPESVQAQWGWNKPGAFEAQPNQSDYLNRLADEAGAWFNVKPGDKADTSKRIGQLVLGCEKLLNAPHTQLSARARDELRVKCRLWMAQLADSMDQLKVNRDPAAVRNDVDQLVRRMQTFLREATAL